MKPMNDYMEAAEAHVLHTYNRFPIVLEKGDGVYLYDTDGKKYLDFAAGIAVFGLGYHYPGYDEVLKEQIDKVTNTSIFFYHVPRADAEEKRAKESKM